MSDTQIDGLADGARAASDRDLRAAISHVLDALPSGHGSDQCQDCGRQIESLRRELLPGATQCAGCARRRAQTLAPSLN